MSEPWLHQYPKDKKQTNGVMSALGGIAGLLVLIMIVGEVTGNSPSGWLFVWLFLDLFMLICIAILSWLTRISYQICPRCHHYAASGYTVCAGCGYRVKEESPCRSS